ncbi:CDP-glycerol glycerophosphotransferase (TagB/SpsB family) [Bacillus fengqiuensis]|nr:CDP-glycerol glycerophosphotransferase (TagB/SpsB family) [Bacillus fengqiuensis]
MNKVIKKIGKIFLSIISKVVAHSTKTTPNSILIIETSFPSGSNTKIIEPHVSKKYKVKKIKSDDYEGAVRSIKTLLKRLKFIRTIAKYELILSTHGTNKVKKNQILIDFWHGIPLKSMVYMEPVSKDDTLPSFNMDYLITTSKFSSTLMNACLHIEFNKHQILGQPRTDYFYNNSNKLKYLITNIENYKKVILYMPTFREGYASRVEGKISNDLFKFNDEENSIRLFEYLKKENYLLILKLHPIEEEIVIKKYGKYLNEIALLTSESLNNQNIDLYEIMNEIDLLITDYSSIYFDYLLLNRPIIFASPDIEEYRTSRGLVLEPYSEWTPGSKVNSYNNLIKEIEINFKNDPYQVERNRLLSIFHHYNDGNAVQRVVDFIDNIMKK